MLCWRSSVDTLFLLSVITWSPSVVARYNLLLGPHSLPRHRSLRLVVCVAARTRTTNSAQTPRTHRSHIGKQLSTFRAPTGPASIGLHRRPTWAGYRLVMNAEQGPSFGATLRQL